ncbi:maleylpyruvate isomerase family mycothiol-dependent enzyme [Streptomyces ziwulingensis]|uniref:Maleylpyruvate isomerase family mycothiol-dependent enzyme n=1 Tax=Streptomyces ziwulingensis TaxID=1045501 RepID=A0ABP9CQ17_9ACTN
MRLPLETELPAERIRLLHTLSTLSDEVFESGPTLCAGWSPRDVLGHLLGVDRLLTFYRPWRHLAEVNRRQVRRARGLSRDRLMAEARAWARRPAWSSRLAALTALGDLAVHHQDIVRGLGVDRDLPLSVPSYILWDGAMLSSWSNLRILRYRVIPTDGHPPLGPPEALRLPEVLGGSEALGMWLAGRDSVAGELRFTSSEPVRPGHRAGRPVGRASR